MRHPQLLIYESDGHVADLLRETARALKWAFREPRQVESCLRLLDGGSPSVLVVHHASHAAGERTRREAGQELVLLERAAWLYPNVRTILVCDQDTEPASLAWDLGAHFVLGPLAAREQLPGIVVGLMEAVAGRPAEVIAEG